MTRRRTAALAAALTIVTAVTVACAPLTAPQAPPTSQPDQSAPHVPAAPPAPNFYEIVKVTDGDTFTVSMNGSQEKIRLIGVDTPETKKPNTDVQCFGPEASTFTHTFAHQFVRLERDSVNDNRDRFGRLLRYAYLSDGSMLNKTIVAQGYGFAYLKYDFDDDKEKELSEAHGAARAANRGLWGACDTVESKGQWQTKEKR